LPRQQPKERHRSAPIKEEGEVVIDPDRVGQLVCMPGERVRVELGFRWDAEPQAVVANFRKFVGSRFSARNLGKQITLEGRRIRHVAEGTRRTCRWYSRV
jgi:hypothetical protein